MIKFMCDQSGNLCKPEPTVTWFVVGPKLPNCHLGEKRERKKKKKLNTEV